MLWRLKSIGRNGLPSRRLGRLASLLVVAVLSSTSSGQDVPVAVEWPVGKSPREVGKRVADEVLRTKIGAGYCQVNSCYATLLFAEATGDTNLRDRIVAAYDDMFMAGKSMPRVGHVDYNVFGVWPFQLYRQTGKEEYLGLARHLADNQFERPRGDGLTRNTRFMVDDMYMVGSLQAQAYRTLGKRRYADRCALQLCAYIQRLQQPNGLFHHTPTCPFFWGRGNGWGAVAMTLALGALPADHEDLECIREAYTNMMGALVEHQDPNGMWHQLLDDPTSYEEASCTGMFVSALATGVREGWLPRSPYGDVARRGWLALTDHVRTDGKVGEVCRGTGPHETADAYRGLEQRVGDGHGEPAVLWAATALVRLHAGGGAGGSDVQVPDLGPDTSSAPLAEAERETR